RVAHLASAPGVTPRMLMTALQRAIAEGPAPVEEEAAETVDEAELIEEPAAIDEARRSDAIAEGWTLALRAARLDLDANDEADRCIDLGRLIDAVVTLAAFLPRVSVKSVRETEPAQIRVETPHGRLAIALLQHANHKTTGAALDRLRTIAAAE